MAVVVEDDGADNRVESDGERTRGEVRVELRGRRNRVVIGGHFQTAHPAHVVVCGDDNVIALGDDIHLLGAADNPGQRTRITVSGNRNHVALGRRCAGSFAVHVAAHDGAVTLGERCTAVMARFQLLERAIIVMGNDCMMGAGIVFQASDGHPIFDRETGARINPARDIHVGDHVWFGVRARILKGVDIGSGSVIGAGAIVTGSIPANCVAVGVPARVVRENVEWRRDELQLYARVEGTIEL